MEKGSDSFVVEASKLQPNWIHGIPAGEGGSPFGAAECIGDFTADQYGNAANTSQLIAEAASPSILSPAFAKDLNSVGMWVRRRDERRRVPGANSPVTGFDDDGKAGAQMLSSGATLLP